MGILTGEWKEDNVRHLPRANRVDPQRPLTNLHPRLSMLATLPPELIELICAKFDLDDAHRALVALQSTCRATCEVARLSLLWEPLYELRWRRSSKARDQERRRQHEGDFRALYGARATLDRGALVSLNNIIVDRATRSTNAVFLADDLGRDVWNVLMSCSQKAGAHLTDLDDTWTRRYWARMALGAIAHKEAVLRAANYANMSLEEAVTDLSAFFALDIEDASHALLGFAQSSLTLSCRLK